MTDNLIHGFHSTIDENAVHVDTVLQQLAKLGESAGQKLDTQYWETAQLHETCQVDDIEWEIVWMAWLAQRARHTPDSERDTAHINILARRLETFNGKKKQRSTYLSQALIYVTCAGYMDQSFGDAPPSPTRRAMRENCLVMATHADACDMPIVRQVWMHLFARSARASASETLKALLAWVLREESEAAGLCAVRVLVSLEETWKQLPLADVRGMRVLYQKLLERAAGWDLCGNAKVLWLGHLHRVQARSPLVQQRASFHMPHVVEHVMESISGAENTYIIQIALAILYEGCLWRHPDKKLAVVLYSPQHQKTMEEVMGKLLDQEDCYSTAQQACVLYFRYLKFTYLACIPQQVYEACSALIIVPNQNISVLIDCLGLLQGTGDMDASYATPSMLKNILGVCLQHLHDRFVHEELVQTLVHLESALEVSSVLQQEVARNVLCCLRTTFTHDPARMEPWKVAWLRAWALRADEDSALFVWDEAAGNGSVSALLTKMQSDNHKDVLEMLTKAMTMVVWRESVQTFDLDQLKMVIERRRAVATGSVPGREAVCSPDFLQHLLRPYFRPACGLDPERIGILLLGVGVFEREALHESSALVRRVLQKIARLGHARARQNCHDPWRVLEALLAGVVLEEALVPIPRRTRRAKLQRIPPRPFAAVVLPSQHLECVVCLDDMDENDENFAFCCASAYSLCEKCSPTLSGCVICNAPRSL